jgi:amino acid transporter
LAKLKRALGLAALTFYSVGIIIGIGIIALFTRANTAPTVLIVGSRMRFSMARSGDMPPFSSGS